MSEDLEVGRRLVIPGGELEWRFSRSGGPGGQHANKADTRVELRWNPRESVSLDPETRERLLQTLGARLDADGSLRIVVADTRSQRENRRLALERMRAILAESLRPKKKRRPTRPTRASKERRLEAKKRRGERKKERRRKDW